MVGREMIVFTIAYGQSYIDKFFDLCLPSLMTPGNLPAIACNKPDFLFLTHSGDEQYARERITQSVLNEIFGKRISVASLPHLQAQTVDESLRHGNLLGLSLLTLAMNHCIQNNRSFLFAVPDLIYADGTVKSCDQLHRLTGKVVATFNGRVKLQHDYKSLTVQEILQIQQRDGGLARFFFENLSQEWKNHLTHSLDHVCGDAAGHLIYDDGSRCYLFCSSPNPLVGKFVANDIFAFFQNPRFVAWDHEWCSSLLNGGRLVVQTDLDRAMSIEIDDEDQLRKNKSRVGKGSLTQIAGKFEILDMNSLRNFKFDTPFSSLYFTSSYHRR
jgi:hypothetical protein